MADKPDGPVSGDTRAADLDPAANGAFVEEMLGDRGGYSEAQAIDKIVNSEGLLETLLSDDGDNPGEGDDGKPQPPRSDPEEQGDEPSSDDDDETVSDEDGQDDTSPIESSEDAGDGRELFTQKKDGTYAKASLDDVEVPFMLDGEEQHLTLSEIQRELTENRLRRDDYSRKTQEVSRRIAEGIRRQTAERQAALDRGYERLEVILHAFGGSLDRDVDFESLKKQHGGDAEKAGHALAQMQTFQSKLKEAEEDLRTRQQEQSRMNIDTTLAAVQDATPEWRDNRVFQRELGNLRDFFLSQGLDSDDITAILQKPAYFHLARKAYQGEQLIKKVKETRTRSKKPIRLGKNVAPTTPEPKPKARRARVKNRAPRDPVLDSIWGVRDDGSAHAQAVVEGILKESGY